MGKMIGLYLKKSEENLPVNLLSRHNKLEFVKGLDFTTRKSPDVPKYSKVE